MSEPLRLILLGIIGQIPFAGVVWQVLHYLEGFRRLGFDVYYIEDNGAWPYDPEKNMVTDDCTYTIGYLGRLMQRYGFAKRWAYRAAAQGNETFGLTKSELLSLLEKADILVNLTGSTRLRPEHLRIPVRIYLETDPVLPQIEVAKRNSSTLSLLGAHTHHFTYGENLGAPDCGVPVERFHYHPTRQPIVLDWWRGTLPTANNRPVSNSCFTTIASWRQSGKDLEWNGELYTWSKHHEFLKIIDLPSRISQPLELALAVKSKPKESNTGSTSPCDEDSDALRLLAFHGWRIIDGRVLSKDLEPYRDYIVSSRGEFTVAKDQNVRLHTGWFSDRSACYLAAGRPVITQDTGFGKFIPTGEGLFAFKTLEEIISAFDAINSNYKTHSDAARAIAEEYFRAEKVLAKVLEDVGVQ